MDPRENDDEDNDDDEKKKRRGSKSILKPSGHHQEAANKAALPQSPPETGCCQGLCLIYGDPHVISFDGAGSTFSSMGSGYPRFELLWVVYSQSVKIQAW